MLSRTKVVMLMFLLPPIASLAVIHFQSILLIGISGKIADNLIF
jgi:hypothetical protein